jgi:endoglucanase Acf2
LLPAAWTPPATKSGNKAQPNQTGIKKATPKGGLFAKLRSKDYFEAASEAAGAASEAAEAASEAAGATSEATSEAAEATSEAADAASAAGCSVLPQAARAMAAIIEASRSDFFMLVSSKGVSKNRRYGNYVQSPQSHNEYETRAKDA